MFVTFVQSKSFDRSGIIAMNSEQYVLFLSVSARFRSHSSHRFFSLWKLCSCSRALNWETYSCDCVDRVRGQAHFCLGLSFVGDRMVYLCYYCGFVQRNEFYHFGCIGSLPGEFDVDCLYIDYHSNYCVAICPRWFCEPEHVLVRWRRRRYVAGLVRRR